jgi:NYN domain/OST-HTH/LOTUS domain
MRLPCILASHRLEPRHHGQVAAGKNATDIALVVTVMHLYMQGLRKFCIVASDSDYTPLVAFLCDQGCLIMIIGNATTPKVLQEACSVFVEIPSSQAGSTSKSMQTSLEREELSAKMSHEHLKVWVLEALLSYEPSPYAWVQVPQFWNFLVRYRSSFKPKAYGYKNIRILLEAFPELFQVRPYKGQENVHEVRRVKIKTSH